MATALIRTTVRALEEFNDYLHPADVAELRAEVVSLERAVAIRDPDLIQAAMSLLEAAVHSLAQRRYPQDFDGDPDGQG